MKPEDEMFAGKVFGVLALTTEAWRHNGPQMFPGLVSKPTVNQQR